MGYCILEKLELLADAESFRGDAYVRETRSEVSPVSLSSEEHVFIARWVAHASKLRKCLVRPRADALVRRAHERLVVGRKYPLGLDESVFC